MVWTSSQVPHEENDRLVSLFVSQVPIIMASLILISKNMAHELVYSDSIAFQYYFGFTNNFFMGVFS